MNATTPDTKTAAANKFHAFMRGYRHGGGGKAKCRDHLAHPTLATPYLAGYDTARVDTARAADAAMARFDYVPSPFRSEGES